MKYNELICLLERHCDEPDAEVYVEYSETPTGPHTDGTSVLRRRPAVGIKVPSEFVCVITVNRDAEFVADSVKLDQLREQLRDVPAWMLAMLLKDRRGPSHLTKVNDDPELEKLLQEEEEIERRWAEDHKEL